MNVTLGYELDHNQVFHLDLLQIQIYLQVGEPAVVISNSLIGMHVQTQQIHTFCSSDD